MRLAALPGLPNPTKNHKMLLKQRGSVQNKTHRRITDGQWQQEARPDWANPSSSLLSGRLSVHILSAISRVIKIPLPTRLNPRVRTHTLCLSVGIQTFQFAHVAAAAAATKTSTSSTHPRPVHESARVTRQSFIRIKGSGMQRVRK